MSVIVHDRQDLEDLAVELEARRAAGTLSIYVPRARVQASGPFASTTPEEERGWIGLVMNMAQAAECAAHVLSYGDAPPRVEPVQHVATKPHCMDDYELSGRLSGLRYNAMSQGGTSFLPAEAREALESWEVQLLRGIVATSIYGVGPGRARALAMPAGA